MVFGKKMTKTQENRYKTTTFKASTMSNSCPPHSFSSDVDFIAKSLGMECKQLSTRIHELKTQIQDNPDVLICFMCGEVFAPGSGDSIGNLRV
jgi:hypothetical protein